MFKMDVIAMLTQKGVKKISPYLYGRNIDKISDGTAETDTTEEAFISQMLEAGIHFLRANNGNNATRYNWRHKMTVHPDWYNNVYSHDWANTAQKVLGKMPGIDAILREMCRLGARTAFMTGSGSTVVGAFDDPDAARIAAGAFENAVLTHTLPA